MLCGALRGENVSTRSVFLGRVGGRLFSTNRGITGAGSHVDRGLDQVVHRGKRVGTRTAGRMVGSVGGLLVRTDEQGRGPSTSLRCRAVSVGLPLRHPLALAPMGRAICGSGPSVTKLDLTSLRDVNGLCGPCRVSQGILESHVGRILGSERRAALTRIVRQGRNIRGNLSRIFKCVNILGRCGAIMDRRHRRRVVFARGGAVSVPRVVVAE